MITEDYVSFETAKLMKEKGFDAECDYLYVNGDIIRARGGKCNWNNGETLFTDYKNECSAPTIQMTMKWLREVHKINIEIITYWTKDKSMVYGNRMVRDATLLKEIDVAYNSYEEACERAIKYCLENLI